MPSWTIHMTQTVRVDARTEHAARAAARRVVEQQPARLKVPAPIGQESLLVIESVDSAESTEADSWWDGYLLGWRHALDLDVLPPTACRFNHDLGVVFGDDRPSPWPALELPLTILYSPANSRWLPPTQSNGEQR